MLESFGKININMEKVQVYIQVSGDYCSFSEMSFIVVYDLTNKMMVSPYHNNTVEELENWSFNDNGGGYSDVRLVSAVLVDGEYYVNLD